MWPCCRGFMNRPHQSLVNLCFSQTFERLFSKKKRARTSPRGRSVVKCREVEGKIWWNGLYPFHKITGFTLTLLLGLPSYYSISRERSLGKEEFQKQFRESGLFLEQIWSRDRRQIGIIWISGVKIYMNVDIWHICQISDLILRPASDRYDLSLFI